MYWYKTKLQPAFIAFILLLTGLQSCKEDSDVNNSKQFFDLKGFFSADTARLRKADPMVNKTVTYNGVPETKKIHIKDWGSELGLFIESDINKPAWKYGYIVTSTPEAIIYKAIDTTLKTRLIVIKKEGSKVKWIMISNHTTNALFKKTFVLYETYEKLTYFPDSLYLIEKMQRVKLLGTNTYRIEGELKF